MNKTFIALMKKRAGNGSVGPSTARGMGPPGTIKAAKTFLHNFNLKSVNAHNEASFLKELNKTTEKLRRKLPRGGRHWGSSRKFLNIFLRNCLYNRYLCDHYRIGHLEAWLEVPLDSHVAKGLRLEEEGKDLPRWKTVIGLKRSVSGKFQNAATLVAKRKKMARVHLDNIYYRSVHMADKAGQKCKTNRV